MTFKLPKLTPTHVSCLLLPHPSTGADYCERHVCWSVCKNISKTTSPNFTTL